MERRQREAYVTLGIMAVNVIYFLYLDLAGSSEDVGYMLKHGAMYTPYVLEGEWFRILFAVFMHFGIRHLVGNMLILFLLGTHLEKALGKIKYLLFYLGCGCGANLVSICYDLFLETNSGIPMNTVSAGASGAIFGVSGGLLFVVLANRGRLDDLSTGQVMIMMIFSLCLGFQSADTDNLAHISGGLIGFLLAMMLYRRDHRGETQKGGNLYG